MINDQKRMHGFYDKYLLIKLFLIGVLLNGSKFS